MEEKDETNAKQDLGFVACWGFIRGATKAHVGKENWQGGHGGWYSTE